MSFQKIGHIKRRESYSSTQTFDLQIMRTASSSGKHQMLKDWSSSWLMIRASGKFIDTWNAVSGHVLILFPQ